jgi:hypothetical protein
VLNIPPAFRKGIRGQTAGFKLRAAGLADQLQATGFIQNQLNEYF